ncbi:MAG: hypothetical protein ACOYNC_18695 [Bacteroidales bacterium]
MLLVHPALCIRVTPSTLIPVKPASVTKSVTYINTGYSTFFMRQASTSQSYQEPPTNIVNGLGVFTGINADTLYLKMIQQ